MVIDIKRKMTSPFGSTGTVVTNAKEFLCVAVLCSTMLLTQSMLAQTVVPMPYIAKSFHLEGNAGEQSWPSAAFSLTVGTFVLPAGRLGDMFGHRLMVSIGFVWTAISQMIAGLVAQFTESHIGFDILRGFHGIGSAILLPNAIAILARLYQPGSLKKFISFCAFAATAPNGFVLGGVFSSLLAQNSRLGWYWAFYVGAIAFAVCFVITRIAVPSDNEVQGQLEQAAKDAHRSAHPDAASLISTNYEHHFDPWGTAFGVSGLVLFNFAFNQAIVVGWQTPYVYVLLIIGILFFVAFVFAEARARDPLIPLDAFHLRSILVLGCLALGWSSFGTFTFYSFLFLQNLRKLSPLASVVQFIPVGGAGIIAAFTSVHFLQRLGPAWVMLLSMCAFCAGNALVGFMPVQQTYWIQMFLATVFTPFGMDMSFPSGSILISDELPPERQGTAGSLVNTVVNYSIAFGLGLAGTVEMKVNHQGSDLEKGFRGALWLGMGLAGLGIVCALVLVIEQHVHGKQTSKTKAAKVLEEGSIEHESRENAGQSNIPPQFIRNTSGPNQYQDSTASARSSKS